MKRYCSRSYYPVGIDKITDLLFVVHDFQDECHLELGHLT